MKWFTSDLHFNHTNIAGPSVSTWNHGYRDFDSVYKMNETILKSINDRVDRNDELWILGDFAFGDRREIPALRQSINCQNVNLVYGNHDKHIERNCDFQDLFSSVQYYKELHIDSGEVHSNGKKKSLRAVLFHYSLRVWNKSHHGSVCLYAHSHGSLPDIGGRTMDVGWCVHRRPLSEYELYERMINIPVLEVDHHNAKTAE